jgi:DNA ligase-1
LAHKWEPSVDPTGWWLSEKLVPLSFLASTTPSGQLTSARTQTFGQDGVRAYWNGKAFISRLGNAFYAPGTPHNRIEHRKTNLLTILLFVPFRLVL